jgi:hypothetical protein
LNFGNNLLALNHAIFYCEILGCQKVILNKYQLERKWFIIKPVYIKKLNISIMLGSNVDCKSDRILCFYEISWPIYYPKIIKPEVRIQLVKKEILRNLPEVKINPDDLFIHIRGGDIFRTPMGRSYAQPPLCYYEKIINKNKSFKNIYVISIDRSNVVIEALLKNHKNIFHKRNNIEYDISLLTHAYNIVLSISSFAFSSIKLNDNLINIWEFDIIRLSRKFLFLHHHIFKFNIKYKIFTMKPSQTYINKMFKWERSQEQIKLMLEDKCPYDFIITKPYIQ